jgi:hypothetical protein
MNGVAIIDRASAIEQTAQSLGVAFEAGEAPVLNRKLLAQSIRRTVFNAAPCAAHTLCSLVLTALAPLSDDEETLRTQIEDAIHDLIAAGDILEMRANSEELTVIVLRPAPPAFVMRLDGTFIIIGISGDEITPICQLPVRHHASGLRDVRVDDAQGCRAELLDLGLIELPERLWLNAPATMSAADFAALWRTQLPPEASPEVFDDIEILDKASSNSFYKGRWSPLRPKHTGIFVARRPQRFGAKLWCLVDVKSGTVNRFIDIQAKDSRTRDCDEAWRLQAALDALAGNPQQVRVSTTARTAILSFSAPLPAWASRRLNLLGEQVTLPRALLAFEIPIESIQSELRWLGESLWLVRNDEGEVA